MNFGIHPVQDALFMLSILEMPDKEDPAGWVWQLYFSSMTEDIDGILKMSNEERLVLLKDRTQAFAEPWRSAMQWVPEGTDIPTTACMYWANPVAWDNHGGKITLAGDSAHPVPPYRGQGVNNAIQDAANYVTAIMKIRDGKKSKDVIDKYDEEVLERGTLELKLSLAQTEASHKVSVFMESPLAKIGIKQKSAAD